MPDLLEDIYVLASAAFAYRLGTFEERLTFCFYEIHKISFRLSMLPNGLELSCVATFQSVGFNL
jgi:hypothetical protein